MRQQGNLGPKYRIYSAGRDTHLVVSGGDPDTAIRKARCLFPSYMLDYPNPLTARPFRDEKGGEQRMTRTEKAQLIRWLRFRRDSWRIMARRPENMDNGLSYIYDRIANALHAEARRLHHRLTDPFGPVPRFPALC